MASPHVGQEELLKKLTELNIEHDNVEHPEVKLKFYVLETHLP